MKSINEKFIVKVSNSSHMNWAPAHDFEVFDEKGCLILSGTHEYDVETTEVIDTFDEEGKYDGSYQESGDFSSGYRQYNYLDTFKVTVNFKFVKYFPYSALKCLMKHFKAGGIYLNW